MEAGGDFNRNAAALDWLDFQKGLPQVGFAGIVSLVELPDGLDQNL